MGRERKDELRATDELQRMRQESDALVVTRGLVEKQRTLLKRRR